MRKDVLALIVGWTMVALIAPLLLCFIVTCFLDDVSMAVQAFLTPLILSAGLGTVLLAVFVHTDTTERLRDREAFAAVALAWPFAVLIGSLPFWLGGVFHGPFTDSEVGEILRGAVNSWFEAMSGFTTTGSTVIDHKMSPNCVIGVTSDCINSQPRGILLWRSLTQWLGGMGIIMLGMLLLSRILGGGMALARAELTGPSLSRLRPRVQQTALALWSVYFFLTLAEILLLIFLGNMGIFDAVNHGFTTMASGGFSTHDASIGYFESAVVETIIIVFMLITGLNFTLIWFLREGDWRKAFRDEEARWYVLIITTATLLVFVALQMNNITTDREFRDSLFTVISIGTSTGYSSVDYMTWPVMTHVILILLMIVGASAGSTSGGLKILRINLALKVAWREIARIAQPNRIQRIRMNGEVVKNERLSSIIGMLFVWILLFSVSCIFLAMLVPNADLENIFSLVASALGNTGPALGDFGPSNTYSSLNPAALMLISILMWFGRLELLTALLVLHPKVWQREKRKAPERKSVQLIKDYLEKED
ncbi:MAG: TrkH family potassium uptake protein [Candidatus Thermoplasmatota archaeon]|nr:TrkH family potassium uptake protein [Candidatus Thermoplasmatota archaeon]